MAWTFVGGEILLAPADELVGARCRSRLELDDGARRFTPFLIRLGDHCDDLDRRMFVQRVFDFDGGNVFAAGNDDVLGTILELDIAVWMHDAEIAGMKPA